MYFPTVVVLVVVVVAFVIVIGLCPGSSMDIVLSPDSPLVFVNYNNDSQGGRGGGGGIRRRGGDGGDHCLLQKSSGRRGVVIWQGPEVATTTRARERERPTDRGMRISASSKGIPRRRRPSIFRGKDREYRGE